MPKSEGNPKHAKERIRSRWQRTGREKAHHALFERQQVENLRYSTARASRNQSWSSIKNCRAATAIQKRQRAAALQDLSDIRYLRIGAKRLGVRLPSAAFARTTRSNRHF